MTIAQRRTHLAAWVALGGLLALGLFWAWSIRPSAPGDGANGSGASVETRP